MIETGWKLLPSTEGKSQPILFDLCTFYEKKNGKNRDEFFFLQCVPNLQIGHFQILKISKSVVPFEILMGIKSWNKIVSMYVLLALAD